MRYEYICDNCEEIREIYHPITANWFVRCPKCNTIMRQVISGGNGFIFKGTGFYCKDYPKGKGKNEN